MVIGGSRRRVIGGGVSGKLWGGSRAEKLKGGGINYNNHHESLADFSHLATFVHFYYTIKSKRGREHNVPHNTLLRRGQVTMD